MNIVDLVAIVDDTSKTRARNLIKGGGIRLGHLDEFREWPAIVSAVFLDIPDGRYCFRRGKDPVNFSFVSVEGKVIRVHDLSGYEKLRWVDGSLDRHGTDGEIDRVNHQNHGIIMESLEVWANRDFSPELANRYLKILEQGV